MVKTDGGIDQELVKVLAHPARVQALHILNQRVASPKELAFEIGIPVGRMAYHIRELAKVGWVDLVRTEQRRGATEHHYRAVKQAVFSDEDWAQVPMQVRSKIVGMEIRETMKLVGASVESGTFEQRGNRHHSLHEFVVDEQGWDAVMGLLEETMNALAELRVESDERRAGEAAQAIPIAVSLLGFEKVTE
jgi:DNA-binding transcriptional ArsR family regulator